MGRYKFETMQIHVGQEQAEQGIRPNTIRLSIGTENIDDIIADLDSAFAALDE